MAITYENLDGATEAGPDSASPANAGEFAARFNSWTPERREEWYRRRVSDSREAMVCFEQMHAGRIEMLEAENERLTQAMGTYRDAMFLYASERDALQRRLDALTREAERERPVIYTYEVQSNVPLSLFSGIGNQPTIAPDWLNGMVDGREMREIRSNGAATADGYVVTIALEARADMEWD